MCERNSDHTLDVKATKAQSTITEKERHEPSCGAAGDIVWEAVVEVGEQEYKSERTEPLPATGAHSPDEYGVCDVCHQYTGETKDLNTSFAVDASGELFFRVPIIEHAHYVAILAENNKPVSALNGAPEKIVKAAWQVIFDMITASHPENHDKATVLSVELIEDGDEDRSDRC